VSTSFDKTVRIWNIKTGEQILSISAHNDWVLCAAFSNDGEKVVSGSKDKTIRVWDIKKREEIHCLIGQDSAILSVDFFSCDTKIVAYNLSNIAIVWDLNDDKCTTHKEGWFNKIAFSFELCWRILKEKTISTLMIAPLNKAIAWYPMQMTNAIHNQFIPIFAGNKDEYTILLSLEGCETVLNNGHFTSLKNNNLAEINASKMNCTSSNDQNLNQSNGNRISFATIRQKLNAELQQFNELFVNCPKCSQKFEPPTSVIETIKKISLKAGLLSNQSSYLELPDEVWEEIDLIDKCPECGEKLRFNPFIVSVNDSDFYRNSINTKTEKDIFPIIVTTNDFYTVKKVEVDKITELGEVSDEIFDAEIRTLDFMRNIKIFIQNNQYQEAIIYLKKYPFQNDSVKNTLGYCYLKLGNYEIALDYFRNLVKPQIFGWKENTPLLYKRNFILTLLLLKREEAYVSSIKSLETSEILDEGIKQIIKCYTTWKEIQKEERNKLPFFKKVFGNDKQTVTPIKFDFPVGELDI